MRLVVEAEKRAPFMMETTAFPLARPMRAKLYVLTYGGVVTTDIRLQPPEPQVAELWKAADALVTIIEQRAEQAAVHAHLTTKPANL